MHFSLDRMWQVAFQADREGGCSWREGNWPAFHTAIYFRNIMMDHIFAHPDNIFSREAIMCRVIAGLSGSEDQLK